MEDTSVLTENSSSEGLQLEESILCQNEVILSNQINRTNELLNKLCKENGFIYFSNSNITPSHLSKDCIHLNDIGTFKLGDNFVKRVSVSGSYLKAQNA